MWTWTTKDERFLRSLGITSSDPPAPLPRFRVEASDRAGFYRVLDARRAFRVAAEIGPPVKEPRESAEDLARQLNEKHGTEP